MGQKENKLIKHNGKYEFGRLLGRYQILRQKWWSLLGARKMVHDPKGEVQKSRLQKEHSHNTTVSKPIQNYIPTTLQ
jgi:hypothetical protein